MTPRFALITLAALGGLLPASSASAGDDRATQCRILLERGRTQIAAAAASEGKDAAARVKGLADWERAYSICRGNEVPPSDQVKAVIAFAAVVGERHQLDEKRRLPATETLYRDEIAALRAGHGDGPVIPLLVELAGVVAHQGRFDESLAITKEAATIAERVHGAESVEMARALIHVGIVQQIAKQPKAAEAALRRAASIASAACGPRCDLLASAYGILHDLLKNEPGRGAEAEAFSQLAMDALPDAQ